MGKVLGMNSNSLRMLKSFFMFLVVSSFGACKSEPLSASRSSKEHDCETSEDCSSNFDGKSLPSYMVRANEIKSLLPMFLSERRIAGPANEISTAEGWEESASSIERHLRSMLDINDFSPSRELNAFVVNDESINASMNAFQQMKINTGILAKTSSVEMLAVLCHEIAHSARNHVVDWIDAVKDDPKIAPLYKKHMSSSIEYMEKNYDQNTKTYTHNRKAYARALEDLKALSKVLDPYDKRQEAEADAVGSMICAKAGMSPKVFAKAMAGLFSKMGSKEKKGKTGEDLEDGFEIFSSDTSALLSYLFSRSTHPSHDERKAQARSLVEAVSPYYASNAKHYEEWEEDYPKLKAKMSLLPLTSPPPKLTAKSGEELEIPEPGCIKR